MTDTNGHAAARRPRPSRRSAPENAAVIQLTRKDFVSDQEVRWCPGCGDYSILAQTQKVMPDFGYARENIVFISGIGCSGRLPYYMNTYGFHTIHGRAPTLATGLKAARPDLMVWVITGDGDALSIGGNHVIHSMRRNVDINLVMFNNRIYGLTKGQASPTSEFGKKTKSTPAGTVDTPIMPLTIALAAEASFVARSVDTHTEHLQATLERAGRHKGSSFVEVLQNCNIFNDGAWRDFTDREVREDRMLFLEHGKPMIFGKDRDKGIRLAGPPSGGRDHRRERRHRGGPAGPRRARRGALPRADAVADVLAGLPGPGRRPARGPAADPRPADRGPDRGARSPRAAPATSTTCSTAARPGRSSRPRAERNATRCSCPVCGFDNLMGAEVCDNCGADLAGHDVPQPATVVPRPAARRAPRRARGAAAADRRPGHAGRRRDRPDAGRRVGLRPGHRRRPAGRHLHRPRRRGEGRRHSASTRSRSATS